MVLSGRKQSSANFITQDINVCRVGFLSFVYRRISPMVFK
jgi:hypothetical protein